jgi:hypothetical protein
MQVPCDVQEALWSRTLCSSSRWGGFRFGAGPGATGVQFEPPSAVEDLIGVVCCTGECGRSSPTSATRRERTKRAHKKSALCRQSADKVLYRSTGSALAADPVRYGDNMLLRLCALRTGSDPVEPSAGFLKAGCIYIWSGQS